MAQVVVGLGNPGSEYKDTRHNIGQRVVDHLAHQLKGGRWSYEKDWDAYTAHWRGNPLRLLKLHTFMNLSGNAVFRALKKYQSDFHDLVLVYDDLDTPFGRVNTRMSGSPGGRGGGHNGVKSVIAALGTNDFRRVKIGIGRPEHKAQVPDHVLTTFEPEEEEIVTAAVATAAERVLGLLSKP